MDGSMKMGQMIGSTISNQILIINQSFYNQGLPLNQKSKFSNTNQIDKSRNQLKLN